MDLAKQAGLDVSDWANYKGNPASNPKYCYEWALQGSNNVIICNLWFKEMRMVRIAQKTSLHCAPTIIAERILVPIERNLPRPLRLKFSNESVTCKFCQRGL